MVKSKNNFLAPPSGKNQKFKFPMTWVLAKPEVTKWPEMTPEVSSALGIDIQKRTLESGSSWVRISQNIIDFCWNGQLRDGQVIISG